MPDTDTRVTHEEAERYLEELPHSIIARLPDTTETREAKRLVDVTADLVHQAIEKTESA